MLLTVLFCHSRAERSSVALLQSAEEFFWLAQVAQLFHVIDQRGDKISKKQLHF